MSQLVSVPVVTYNAVAFIEETLESIFNQTHQNIQLIISDDCSKDNTVDIVQKWCKQPKVITRFTDIVILTVPVNAGVSANCNRSITASTAEWIKFIAGDDILLPNCIEENIKFVSNNHDAKIIFSQVQVFQDTFENKNFVKNIPEQYPDNLMHVSFTALDQFKLLIESDRISYTPSYFFNKKTIENIGCYDEANKLVEDYPMWLNLTQSGIKLFYFHIPTVGYRIHANATNNTGEVLFKPAVLNGYLVKKKYAHQYLPWWQAKQEMWAYHLTKGFSFFKITKPTEFNKSIYKIATVYCNPFFIIGVVARRI
jgi:alpha-1,3-rhamnosyltransferase